MLSWERNISLLQLRHIRRLREPLGTHTLINSIQAQCLSLSYPAIDEIHEMCQIRAWRIKNELTCVIMSKAPMKAWTKKYVNFMFFEEISSVLEFGRDRSPDFSPTRSQCLSPSDFYGPRALSSHSFARCTSPMRSIRHWSPVSRRSPATTLPVP